jgi:hypothetical protein
MKRQINFLLEYVARFGDSHWSPQAHAFLHAIAEADAEYERNFGPVKTSGPSDEPNPEATEPEGMIKGETFEWDPEMPMPVLGPPTGPAVMGISSHSVSDLGPMLADSLAKAIKSGQADNYVRIVKDRCIEPTNAPSYEPDQEEAPEPEAK